MTDKVLAINPGSTSTKIAVYENGELILREDVSHSAADLARFPEIPDQLPYRKAAILEALARKGVTPEGCAAFSGRGGGLQPCEGGVYEVNSVMLAHARSGKYGGRHPAALGCQLAAEFAQQYGGRAFVVNGPDTDEFCQEARVTGLADVFRASHVHALNQKETALRVARELGVAYEGANFIVAHLGGGVSITAHRQGRMVDSNDIIHGDGPMAPTRSGALPVKDVIDLCFSGRWTKEELHVRVTKEGGFVDHLGTADFLEIKKRRQTDGYVDLIYRAFLYQISKQIGAMASVLEGRVDAIILTGGIARDEELVEEVKRRVGFIGPVVVRPGEVEMEALIAGALRVLRGEESPKSYTGEPVFLNFDALKGVPAAQGATASIAR